MSNSQRSLPESYRHLNEFAVRYSAGAVIFEQGRIPDRFFLVLGGRVRLDLPRAQQPAGFATRGQLIGLTALADRPAPVTAIVEEDAVLIAVPIDQATAAFAASTDLARETARELARRLPDAVEAELPEQTAEPAEAPPAAPLPAAPGAAASEAAEPDAASGTSSAPPKPRLARGEVAGEAGAASDGWVQALTKLPVDDFDESFFFKDAIDCPACGSRFEYLRVRTAGVRPHQRDSDFHVQYHSEDPTRYGIVVCPTCSYAATHEDFPTLETSEREAIVGARQARGRYDYPNLGGPRTLEESLTALELARECNALRAPSPRRDAVLLHRRAWIERERGDVEAERTWLEQARDAYRQSFELDGEISEESAMRVAYLIGDLSLRLGEPLLGAQWLETATRFPDAKRQSGLERTARDRLADARKLLSELDEAQSA